MGPTNVALVKLYQADQQLRAAEAKLDAAARNVRIQERRVADLAEKLKLAQVSLREQQTRSAQLELDVAARDAHIEKLRTQQQTAKNNKEYQAFLMEINTGKVDRAKVEEQWTQVSEAVEAAKAEMAGLTSHLEAERAKTETMKAQIGETLRQLEAEVEALRPARDAAAAAVPPKGREAYERLAERFDGEALSAVAKPDRRREEYLCTACNMELVRDVYNKLRTRDELVYCPSCRRILYIPEDLTPEAALGTSKPAARRVRATTTKSPRDKQAAAQEPAEAAAADGGAETSPPVEIELRAKGKLGAVLAKAQGETVRSANAAGENPVECEVYIDGELKGIYKGQTAEKLQRAIRYFMGEAQLFGEVRVTPTTVAPPTEPEPEPAPMEEPAAADASPPTPEAAAEPREASGGQSESVPEGEPAARG